MSGIRAWLTAMLRPLVKSVNRRNLLILMVVVVGFAAVTVLLPRLQGGRFWWVGLLIVAAILVLSIRSYAGQMSRLTPEEAEHLRRSPTGGATWSEGAGIDLTFRQEEDASPANEDSTD